MGINYSETFENTESIFNIMVTIESFLRNLIKCDVSDSSILVIILFSMKTGSWFSNPIYFQFF